MINYEIIDQEVPTGLPPAQVVIIHREDGSTESFPVDEANPRYQQFLTEIE